MRPAGLEPAAYWFEASRSIQLSYGRALGPKIIARTESIFDAKACGTLRTSGDFAVFALRAAFYWINIVAGVCERGQPEAGSRYIG